MSVAEELASRVRSHDAKGLCRVLFDLELAPGQAKIVREVVWGGRKTCVKCPTRYGKTVAMGAGLSLYVLLNEGHVVQILSNKKDNCKKIRDQLIECAGECPPLMKLLSEKASSEVSRVKQTLSKQEMKLRDGTEINLQAAGGNVQPEQLDGLGGDLVLVDEADLIPDENFNRGIRRMLGDSPDSRLVLSGNNTLGESHWVDAFKDESYEKIAIGWEQAVQETYGNTDIRPLTREFVEGEQDELPPVLFKQMYEAEFPEGTDNQLVPYNALKEAQQGELESDNIVEGPVVLFGLDVAREGRDHSVLTRVEKHGAYYLVTDQDQLDVSNTERLAHKVQTRLEKELDGYRRISVDSHGIGAGVLDTLRGLGVYATGVKVGVSRKKALRRPDDFKNLKAELYDRVRQLFVNESIVFAQRFSRLVKELDSLETRSTTNQKLVVESSLSKSPDFADSLMLALAKTDPRKKGRVGKAKVY